MVSVYPKQTLAPKISIKDAYINWRINKSWKFISNHCTHVNKTNIATSLPDRYEEYFCDDCKSKIFYDI